MNDNKYPDRGEEAPYEEGYPLPTAPGGIEDNLPPGMGRFAVAPYMTFSQIVNYASRTYRWTHDEALRANRNNALAIRRDPVIMDALRSRQIPTAQLPWHIEVENDQDEAQAEMMGYLTDRIEQIPRFQQLKMHLLEALWFGRYGVQLATEWDWSTGHKSLAVRDFKPINGDKLVFKYSGATGILVHATYQGAWQPTDRGRAHFFSAREREQLIIHKHEPEDADFWEPELAGSLQGVGIRGRIYWLWYLRSQVTAFLMDYLERVGAGGLTIYYYEAGSNASLQEVKTAAEVQWRNNAVLFPRYRDGTTGGPGVEVVQANQSGAALLQSLITDYYDKTIRRYINGQDASDASGAGLGSGIAGYLEGEQGRRIKYDAINLGETITTDLVGLFQKYSKYRDLPKARFVFDVDKPNAGELLQAAQAFFEMGGTIDEDQLRGIIGLEKPQPGHAMLAKMGSMSPAAAGSIPTGVPMLGQPGPAGQPGAVPPEMAAQQGMQPPPGAGPPMQMRARGQRLRFSAEELAKVFQEHYPNSEYWRGFNTFHTPEKAVTANWRPELGAVHLEFRHRRPTGSSYATPKTVQPGSTNFARGLVGLVKKLGQRGLKITYSADEHHAKSYHNLLRRLGWTPEEPTGGPYTDEKPHLWVPPAKKMSRTRETLLRLAKIGPRAPRKPSAGKVQPETIHQTITRQAPDLAEKLGQVAEVHPHVQSFLNQPADYVPLYEEHHDILRNMLHAAADNPSVLEPLRKSTGDRLQYKGDFRKAIEEQGRLQEQATLPLILPHKDDQFGRLLQKAADVGQTLPPIKIPKAKRPYPPQKGQYALFRDPQGELRHIGEVENVEDSPEHYLVHIRPQGRNEITPEEKEAYRQGFLHHVRTTGGNLPSQPTGKQDVFNDIRNYKLKGLYNAGKYDYANFRPHRIGIGLKDPSSNRLAWNLVNGQAGRLATAAVDALETEGGNYLRTDPKKIISLVPKMEQAWEQYLLTHPYAGKEGLREVARQVIQENQQ